MQEDKDTGYIIQQEKVPNAKHIGPGDLADDEIRKQVEAILRANKESLARDGVGFDFIGLEGSAKCVLANQRKFRDGFIDRFVISPILRLALALKKPFPKLLIPEKTLEWWKSSDLEPEITNLVIGTREGTKRVFMIDLSLVHTQSGSLKERVRSAVLQWWNRRFLKKNFGLGL